MSGLVKREEGRSLACLFEASDLVGMREAPEACQALGCIYSAELVSGPL